MARGYENILIKMIYIEDGRLPTIPSHVERLMKSISELGLLEPIIVCRRSRKSPALVLVAGRNRLEACKRLKHKTIAAIVETDESDETDVWRELAEIDENLIRRELTPALRVKLTAKRRAAYLKAHPETKTGGAPGKRGGGKKAKKDKLPSFAKDTADKTGRTERDVRRDATRAKRLGDDLDKVAGTSLDKGEELDALGKMTPEERAPIIARAAAGEKVSARVSVEAQVDRIKKAASRLVIPYDEVGGKPLTAVEMQAGSFHDVLMRYTEDFCKRVKAWHVANEIDEGSQACVVQALEMSSMQLQRTAQDINGR